MTTAENNRRIANVSTRNSSVELLRFIFIGSVVLYHVYLHGLNMDYERLYSLGENLATAPHLALYSFCKIGVTGFMFISGYYGIRMNKSKWISMLLLLAFYAVILTLYYGSDKLGTYLTAFLHPFDLWWFMAVYFFICLMSPLLEKGIEAISQRTFLYIVLGMVGYTYFAHLLGFKDDHNLRLLLTIYMVARYLRIYPPYFTNIYIW